MLRDVLDNTVRKLETTKTAQTRIRDTEQFTKHMSKVLQSVVSLDTYLTTAAEAEENQLISITISPIIRNDITASLKTALSQLNEVYLEATTVTNIDKSVSNFKKHLDSLWVSAVKSNTEQVISLLKTFKQFLPNEDEVSTIVSNLESAITSLPSSKNDVNNFVVKLQKGRELAEQVGADEDIQGFIGKVSGNQATLADITPKVQDWINEHGIAKRIKIRLA